jgi:ABC-type microcin C transport system duplicated ATPase subunit YejF
VEQGRALYDAHDLLALPEERLRKLRGDRLAMIFQEPMTSLNPVLTIGRQLTEGLIEHLGVSQDEANAVPWR